MTLPVEHEITQPESGATPAEIILRPFREFARRQASGGLVLMGASALALLWANSRWAGAYREVWSETGLKIEFGEFHISMNLLHWINDFLMGLFFLLVGLEIKREVLTGELASLRKSVLPIAAAAGGMLLPAAIYAALNAGQPTLRGWGVPMATDIAFSLGVLALLGERAPISLKVFLATLAIADDIGALLVIALFYTEELRLGFLALAAAPLLGMVGLNLFGVDRLAPYMLLGVLVWFFVLESGVHPTIAGVLVALPIPARQAVRCEEFVSVTRRSLDYFDRQARRDGVIMTNPKLSGALHAIKRACWLAEPPCQQLEHALLPWVSLVIVPLFGLANAGVVLSAEVRGAIASPVTLGAALGLVVGKPLGILLASWLAIRIGGASLPSGVTWRQLSGAACLGGIGFTMSLFIGHLAFTEPAALEAAKIGVIGGSFISGVLGWLILRSATAEEPPAPGGARARDHDAERRTT